MSGQIGFEFPDGGRSIEVLPGVHRVSPPALLRYPVTGGFEKEDLGALLPRGLQAIGD